MTSDTELEGLFNRHGFSNFKWINAADIKIKEAIKVKCKHGKNSETKAGGFKPAQLEFGRCSAFIEQFSKAVIFHMRNGVTNAANHASFSRDMAMRMVELEMEVFQSGHRNAFALIMNECLKCKEGLGTKDDCVNLDALRPSPESFCIDLFATMEAVDFRTEQYHDSEDTVNRFAILLVD